MTKEEARLLLHADRHDSAKEIRKKYLRQMKIFHPDNNAAPDLDVRLLNEAYRLLLETQGGSDDGLIPDWDADIVREAFCERTIYMSHTFDDGVTHLIAMARGKYLWNPEAEEFSMLLKSVYEAAHRLAGREEPMVFHYLMQEFIDPIYVLEKLGKSAFRCKVEPALGDEASLQVKASSSRLYAMGKRIYRVSFSDKSLNYVITPLVENSCATAEVSGGVLRFTMTGKKFVRDFSRANEAILKSSQKVHGA